MKPNFPPVPQPIFIGGCDRSGTTLLASLIGGDPETICLPESCFIGQFLPDYDPIESWEAQELLERIRNHIDFSAWREHGCTGDIGSIAANIPYSELIGELAIHYAEHVQKGPVRRFIDHSPENVLHFSALTQRFPNAKLIHVVRDGRATAASILPLDWGPNDVRTAAYHWVKYVGAGLAAQHILGRERCMTVWYEELVSKPVDVMRSVAAFADVPNSGQLHNGRGYRVPTADRAHLTMLGRPPEPSRIDRWKLLLTSRDIQLFEHYTKDFLASLGYTPVCDEGTKPPRVGEEIRMNVRGWYRRHMNRIKHRRRRSSGIPAIGDSGQKAIADNSSDYAEEALLPDGYEQK